jgi:hypothetical protein
VSLNHQNPLRGPRYSSLLRTSPPLIPSICIFLPTSLLPPKLPPPLHLLPPPLTARHSLALRTRHGRKPQWWACASDVVAMIRALSPLLVLSPPPPSKLWHLMAGCGSVAVPFIFFNRLHHRLMHRR